MKDGWVYLYPDTDRHDKAKLILTQEELEQAQKRYEDIYRIRSTENGYEVQKWVWFSKVDSTVEPWQPDSIDHLEIAIW